MITVPVDLITVPGDLIIVPVNILIAVSVTESTAGVSVTDLIGVASLRPLVTIESVGGKIADRVEEGSLVVVLVLVKLDAATVEEIHVDVTEDEAKGDIQRLSDAEDDLDTRPEDPQVNLEQVDLIPVLPLDDKEDILHCHEEV